MRSAFAIVVITAVFGGTLVAGLNYTGALDPEMLRLTEDDVDAAMAGWKTHSVPAEGFAIQLPPEWVGVSPTGEVVFEERKGKKLVASLTVVEASRSEELAQSVTKKAFRRGRHVLTFTTTAEHAASYARFFQHAADSYRALKT